MEEGLLYKFCEIPISHPMHVWCYQPHMTWVDRTDVHAGIEYQCPGWGAQKNTEAKSD